MKKMLNRKENAKRAMMHIQYHDSVVNKPLSLRRVFPTVLSVPFVGWIKQNIYVTFENSVFIEYYEAFLETHRTPSLRKELIDGNSILSVHHRRYVVSPYHPIFDII